MKKLSVIALSLLMVFTMVCPAFAEADVMTMLTTSAPSDDITVVAVNDIHSGVEMLPKLATVAKDADLLVSGGDFSQDGMANTISKGEYTIEVMNTMGFDATVVGNHDFDYGIDQLKKNEELADFPFISANCFLKKDGSQIFDSYTICETKGKKIAFIGVTTPYSEVQSNVGNLKDENGEIIINFSGGDSGKELVRLVQRVIDKARNKVDYVVILSHLGRIPSSEPYSAQTLVSQLKGVDAIINAHDHEIYTDIITTADGKKIPVAEAGSALSHYAVFRFSADGQVSAELFSLADISEDPEIKAVVDGVINRFEEVKNTVVAKTDYDLLISDGHGQRMVRKRETNLGDLITDSMRIVCGADIAMLNGGGIRKDIPAGDITYGNILDTCPFGNALCIGKTKGSVIADALEFAVRELPDVELGGYLQCSGISYCVDANIPSPVVVDELGVYVKLEGERRVFDIKIGEEDLDPDKYYTLVSTGFILKNSGDGYSMFGKENVEIIADEVALDYQALIDYITDFLGGVVGEEYKTVQKRVVLAKKNNSEVPEVMSYRVVRGDSLWKIAKKLLGSGLRWKEIYNANKDIIKNPNLIYVNQVLSINF